MDWYFRSLCRWNKFSEVKGGVTRAQRLWYIWEEAWQLIVSASLAFKTKWRPSETAHPSNHITLLEGRSLPSFSRPAKFLIRRTQTIQASAPVTRHTSRDSSASTVTGLPAGWPKILRFHYRGGARDFLFSKASRPAFGPPAHLFPRGVAAGSWSFTSTHPYAFTMMCIIKHVETGETMAHFITVRC